MKILVTGAAGFIGYHVIKRIISGGYEVLGIDNINSYYSVDLKYARLHEIGIDKKDIAAPGLFVQSTMFNNLRFSQIDITRQSLVEEMFENEQIDIVIHLAAQAGVRYSIENPRDYIQSNIDGFFNILECCRKHRVRHLVYASSSSVYGNSNKVPFVEEDSVDYPVSLYAATKKSNELMAHSYSNLYQLPTTGLRFFTVYGPWGRPDMAPMLFADAISNNKPIKVFNYGDLERDFTYIDDIVEGIVRVMDSIPSKDDSQPFYRLFNIGNSKPVQLLEFIELIEKSLGVKAQKEMLPMQAGDVKRTWADISKLHATVGYKPKTDLKEGITVYIDWYKRYYKKI